jgi:hypothetical protein
MATTIAKGLHRHDTLQLNQHGSPPSEASNSDRRRDQSRSIAINRPRHCDEHSEHLVSTAEYDLATWRMYNRIAVYRQKHPAGAYFDAQESAVHSSSHDHGFLRDDAQVVNDETNSCVQPEDDTLYGEIFDMER